LSSQHRTLYFYLLLWILLIIIGMYKYVSSEAGIGMLSSKSFYLNKQQLIERENKRHERKQFHQQLCNDVDSLVPAEEGGLIEGWTLQGE
jgi:hypothetical protein